MARIERIIELLQKAKACETAANRAVSKKMRLMWQFNADQLRLAAKDRENDTAAIH